jgi:ribonuclease P protein component
MCATHEAHSVCPEHSKLASGRGKGAQSVEQQDPSTRILDRERWRGANRLRASADFQRVRRGRTVNGQRLSLAFAHAVQAADGGEIPTRVGFSVSKRVGRAVTRNRVKRRLREIVRKRLSHVAPGWDIVITARASAAEAEYRTLEEDVRDLLVRAQLWRAGERGMA